MCRCSLMRNMIILRVRGDAKVRLSRIRVEKLRIKNKARYRLRFSREGELFRVLKEFSRIRLILKNWVDENNLGFRFNKERLLVR